MKSPRERLQVKRLPPIAREQLQASPRERDLAWLLERQAQNFAECQGDPEAALAIWRAAVDTFARLEAERRQ